jgi:hypothetical protein
MNDCLFVGRSQPMSDLDRVVDRLANRERPALQYLPELPPSSNAGNQIRNAFRAVQLSGTRGFLTI